MLLQGCVTPVFDHEKCQSKVSLGANEQGRTLALGNSPGWLWQPCSARREGNAALRAARPATRHGAGDPALPAETTSPPSAMALPLPCALGTTLF